MRPFSSADVSANRRPIIGRLSNVLQVLLRQIEIQVLNRKYFSCLPAVKNYRQKFIIRGQFLYFICCGRVVTCKKILLGLLTDALFVSCIFVILVFLHFDFKGGSLVLTASVPGHCLRLTLHNNKTCTQHVCIMYTIPKLYLKLVHTFRWVFITFCCSKRSILKL